MKYSTEKIGKKILEERKKRNWSQQQLGKKIQISSKQISNYENGKLIPPIEILLKLCDIFSCELGYILGEDSYNAGTKLDTIIERTLGLNTTTINTLQHITGNERKCLNFGCESDTYKRILNTFLCDPAFSYLLESFLELESCIKQKEQLFINLEEKYDNEVLSTAFEHYNSTTDYLRNDNTDMLENIYYQAILDIKTYIDKEDEISFSINVNRYKVNKAFERLIDSLYPTTNT